MNVSLYPDRSPVSNLTELTLQVGQELKVLCESEPHFSVRWLTSSGEEGKNTYIQAVCK